MSSIKSPLTLIQVGSGYLGPGITKYDDISNLSKRVVDMYDTDKGGSLGHTELANMMIAMYKSMNLGFTPTKADIDSFARAMGSNREGKVSEDNVSQAVRKYLKVDTDVIKTEYTRVSSGALKDPQPKPNLVVSSITNVTTTTTTTTGSTTGLGSYTSPGSYKSNLTVSTAPSYR